MSVDTHHPQYQKMLPIWQKCLDAAEGEQAVHNAGIVYLPKLKEEDDLDYRARKNRTPFFNATWRTISGLKGMVFRKDPARELPAGVDPYLDNIDLAGTPLDLFAQELTERILTTGRSFALVDFPQLPTDEPLTVAQAEMLGLRPSIQKYTEKQIINWKTRQINNRRVLSLVVLHESVEAGSEFEHEEQDRFRVLDLTDQGYRQRVFVKDDKNNDVLISEVYPKMRGQAMWYIPGVFFGVDDLSTDIDSPPLLDLINMNFHHYTVSADYEHGCHFSGLPTFYVAGLSDRDTKIGVGGTSAIILDNPQAKVGYAEVQGSFDGLRLNLDSKKAEMAVLGARMLEGQKNAVESDQTLKTRMAGEQSTLAAMASVISMGMERLLAVFCEWSGYPSEVKYQLSRDYVPVGMTAQELTALVQSWQAGAISQQTLFDNLQAGEVIDASVTFEEEQERINSQALPVGE